MKPATKKLMKELLVRKNQFIQRHISERVRLGIRFFFSLPQSAQLWLTKKTIKHGIKKKWEEMGQS
jgi:hypothetical protein